MKKIAIKSVVARVLDQAQAALASVPSVLVSALEQASLFISKRPGKIVTMGIGKSGFIAEKIASTLTSLGVPALFVHPTDALHGGLGIFEKADTVIAFSHSGATKELLSTLRHVVKLKIPIIAISGKSDSPLSRIASHVLVYKVQDEGSPHGLAPMASTTTSLVIGDMLCAGIAHARGFTRELFAQLHPSGMLGLQTADVEKIMKVKAFIPLVSHKATFRRAVEVINQKKLGIVGIINEDKRLIGALSDGDVRRSIIIHGEPRDLIQCMTRHPYTIGKDASLFEALQRMEDRKITSLFVVSSDERVEGIIHMHQIIERELL